MRESSEKFCARLVALSANSEAAATPMALLLGRCEPFQWCGEKAEADRYGPGADSCADSENCEGVSRPL